MAETFDFTRRTMLGSALGLGALGVTAPASGSPPVPSDPTSTFLLTATGIPGPGDGADMSVLTWSFGSTNAGNPASSGSGAAASKAKAADFIFVKQMDVASPLLHKACVTGKTIAQIRLSARRGEMSFDYFTLLLESALVVSYMAAPSDTDGYPLDVVHVRFAKIKQTFTPQGVDGGMGTPVSFTFDYAKNKLG